MMQTTTDQQVSPDVVKLTETENRGVRSVSLSRTAIGYVLRGCKYLYADDRCEAIGEGTLYIFEPGFRYEENIVGSAGLFEEITFYVSPAVLQQIILGQNTNYGLTYTTYHKCENCRTRNFATMGATSLQADFFASVERSFRRTGFRHNDICQRIKLNELIYLILSGEECCVRSKLLRGADASYGQFAQTIYDNLFNDISIEALAALTNRSLTSFKKEFRRHFDAPPHKWFIAQRLNRAKLLLLSTNKTISEVGSECAFSNISHFIKLFKSRFRATPAVYRQQHRELSADEPLRSASGE